jgi:hypothetical protein
MEYQSIAIIQQWRVRRVDKTKVFDIEIRTWSREAKSDPSSIGFRGLSILATCDFGYDV